ncbi:hypothetical protein PENTCL1PPCAC_21697, partial [Pristionchus entomophagus]
SGNASMSNLSSPRRSDARYWATMVSSCALCANSGSDYRMYSFPANSLPHKQGWWVDCLNLSEERRAHMLSVMKEERATRRVYWCSEHFNDQGRPIDLRRTTPLSSSSFSDRQSASQDAVASAGDMREDEPHHEEGNATAGLPMDESELLGGDEDLAAMVGDVSQEEEDALLNAPDEPSTSTTSSAATTPPPSSATTSCPSVETTPADPTPMEVPPAEPATPTSHAHDDTFMNDDSETNDHEASDESGGVDDISHHAEETSAGENGENSVGSSSSQTLSAPSSSSESPFIRSIFQVEKVRLKRIADKRQQKMQKQLDRVIGLADEQRSNSRQITGAKQDLRTMVDHFKSLSNQFNLVLSKKEKELIQTTSSEDLMAIPCADVDRAKPSSSKTIIIERTFVEEDIRPVAGGATARAAAAAIAGPSSNQQELVKTQRQLRQIVPQLSALRRMSSSTARQQQVAHMQQLQQTRRNSLPSLPPPQQQQLQPAPTSFRSAGRVAHENVATPLVAPPQPLPTPPSQPQASNGVQRAVPTPNQNGAQQQRQKMQQQHQQRQQQLQQNGVASLSTQPNGHHAVHNGAAAVLSAAAAAAASNGLSPAQLAAQRQLQHFSNRKRPHPQQVQHDQKPPQPLPLTPGMQHPVADAPKVLQHLQKLLQQRALCMQHPKPELQWVPREMDNAFRVPAVADKRKLEVNVPPFNLTRPFQRPSRHLPIDAQKGPLAPQITLTTTHRDYAVSAKCGGRVVFTPPADWPENNARVCLFYYVGTANSGKWSHSDFASMDIERDEDGTAKEVSIKFVISMGRSYLAPGADRKPNGMIGYELIGLVAVACAGSTTLRGDEATFDFAALDAAARELKITEMAERAQMIDQTHPGTTNAAQLVAAARRQPAQLPRAPGAATPAAPAAAAAAAADDDIVDITMDFGGGPL